jgi:hypothetical protein
MANANGTRCWTQSSFKYVEESFKTVEEFLRSKNKIVALKNCIELTKSLRYMLRMFGVPLIGPADIFCNNGAVTMNCPTPESTIKEKHHSIGYHFYRQAVASGTVRIAKEEVLTAARVMSGCRYLRREVGRTTNTKSWVS